MGQASQPPPSTVPAHLALMGSQVVFGLFPVVGLVMFQPGGLTPLGLGAWRLCAGALILILLALLAEGRTAIPARSDVTRLVAGAWLGVAFNQALYLEGLSRSTPINAALIMGLIPVFTFGLAAAVGLERFSGLRFAGVLIALAGALPLLLERDLGGLGQHAAGNLLMVANSFSYSLYLVLTKPLLRRYSPLTVIAWSYVFSLPFVPWLMSGARLLPDPGHAGVWWGLAYTIAFPTVLAYLFNVFALSRIDASTSATYVYAQPLIAGLASWAVFGETPTRQMLVAVPALFLGIWLVSRPATRALAPGPAQPPA